MKRIYAFVLLIFLAFGALADDLMTVSVGNVEVSIPVGWYAQYTKSPQLFYLYSPLEPNDTFQENCNLTIEQLPVEYTVAEYMRLSAEQLSRVYSSLDLVVTSDNSHTISGAIGGTALQQSQYFYIRNRVAYILTFSATPKTFEKFSEVFAEIERSFRIE